MDYTKEYDAESLAREIQEKEQAGLLTKEMASCICVQDILQFLASSVAQRMQKASLNGKCYVEQPFVLGVKAGDIYSDMDSDELLLVQGIIDVYFEEDGELVVLDYKTDKVFHAKDLVDRYHAQLSYYAQALERLTGKRVKEKLIYSFHLAQEIEVNEWTQ